MLYHWAASAVGGERMRLRELCLKTGGHVSTKPLLSLLNVVQICPGIKKAEHDSTICSCLLLNKSTLSKQTNPLNFSLHIFCQFSCLFVSMDAYVLCDIVHTRSSVPVI